MKKGYSFLISVNVIVLLEAGSDIIKDCKNLRIRYSHFRHYNVPARILTLIAIMVPLAILFPTAPDDDKGQKDLGASPYAAYAGIIFLIGVGLAVFFSRMANKYKISMAQQWAVRSYNTYENLSEYSQTKLEHYKTQANKEFSKLVEDISGKLGEVDDKVKWVITFVNPMERLVLHLEQNIMPIITSGNESQSAEIKPYLLNLTSYLLRPSEELLKEILPTSTLSTKSISVSDTSNILSQNIDGRTRFVLPQKHMIVIGLSVIVGIGTYFLAISIEVDKSSAFLGGVTLASALIGGYFAYARK